jgi:hypothetical protein
MKLNAFAFAKVFNPHLMNKVMQTFDSITIVVVASCWGAAAIIIILALYTVHLSVSTKRDVIEAAAKEPALPQLVMRPPEATEMGPIVERLQRRFPDITFALSNDKSLTVSAVDGSKFRTWLTVLSYIDTISPQYRWQIKDLCVGMQCPSGTPMRSVLIARKITFSATPVKAE